MLYITNIGVKHPVRFSTTNATEIELVPMCPASVAHIPHNASLLIAAEAPWDIIYPQSCFELDNWHNSMLSLLQCGVQYTPLPLNDIFTLTLERGVDLTGVIQYTTNDNVLSLFILNYITAHSPETINLYNDFIKNRYADIGLYSETKAHLYDNLEKYLKLERNFDLQKIFIEKTSTLRKKYDHIKFLKNVQGSQNIERSHAVQKIRVEKTTKKESSTREVGAVREVKRHLAYRIGTMVSNNFDRRSFLFAFPFFMIKELLIYTVSPKYKNIALFVDVGEARALMRTKEYKVGQEIVSTNRNIFFHLMFPKKVIKYIRKSDSSG